VRRALAVLGTALAGLTLVACGTTAAVAPKGVIRAVGAENEYANVLSQIGGRYVSVATILQNPNTDPHAFEASTKVAKAVSAAQIVVQNGLGYDTFMNDIEAATPNSRRIIIDVQNVLRLPSSTPNPHLWYEPIAMSDVAQVMARDLSKLEPEHTSYFSQHLKTFDASLSNLKNAIEEVKAKYRGINVAVTEPVADYLLHAMDLDIVTPFVFQADIMNGVDPSPEDISLEDGFFSKHDVRLFVYNQQVVDSLTNSLRENASAAKIPIVGVYETMPTPGYTYQTWMMAEVNAIVRALATGKSTEAL
jgi:zinc/manganese transport system substrate-binding protein